MQDNVITIFSTAIVLEHCLVYFISAFYLSLTHSMFCPNFNFYIRAESIVKTFTSESNTIQSFSQKILRTYPPGDYISF